jgi:hypothetical protein
MVGRNCATSVLLELSLESLTPLLPFLKGERENACEVGRGISVNRSLKKNILRCDFRKITRHEIPLAFALKALHTLPLKKGEVELVTHL